MDKGDYIITPRFCTVKINEVFETENEARKNGYTEPTYYRGDYKVLGKVVETRKMLFAAAKK